ncbi:putative zinc-binding protein [Sporomusa malonica]|uniref:DGC domain-containing protein n=1 Tax=Sporomusa malonica TaxID=112901 RepID=A0A1W1Z9F0_9FIRM|nr:putative zinc-binding protein [Sporomusa malonica]SMC45050.1 DGC domain-containing protein [Sporomusa malonica]
MGCKDECQQNTRILFTCSGCCTEGELSDKIGRQLRKEGYARCGTSCLAGIGAGYPRFINAAREASKVIVIDGCGMTCAKRTLEKAELKPTSYVLTSMGLVDGCDQQKFIATACQQIKAAAK